MKNAFLLILSFLAIALSLALKDPLKKVFEMAEDSVATSRTTFVGPRYLDAYALENLSKRPFFGSDFRLGDVIKNFQNFDSFLFSFKTKGKKVTGLANVPRGVGPFPVVLMIRGYVDRKNYQTGLGTQRAGEAFAAKGYLTLAPDFLGYGGSDNPSNDPIEERFQTYTTLIDLYGLISRLPPPPQRGPASAGESGMLTPEIAINISKIYVWAHSNGGQIALTFLEVIGAEIPSVLWAPVSKPFPYSILYFTDEAEDLGKSLRKVVARFENLYDVGKYSLTEYLHLIKAPILLQHGTKDEAVPKAWSDELNKKLGLLGKEVNYIVYEGADHNLSGSWNEAVEKDLEFFSSH